MLKENGLGPTERLLGIVRNGRNGQTKRLFLLARNGAMDPESLELGKKSELYCEISSLDRILPRLKQQFDAIWSNILLNRGQAPCSVLLTSASKGEGVTYVSERLCLYLAQTYGHRVLYVNVADPMAAPEAPSGPPPEEIIDRLTAGRGLDDLVAASEVPGLFVMSLNLSGGQHALPWLLPEHNAMKTLLDYARERCDIVVIDAQAVLTAPWTATMAKSADVNLLVCRFAVTRREVLNALLEAFKAAGVSPQGVILNARRYSVPQSLYKLLK
ncbi:hypothetical protein ASZ90_002874 [hydrocarbon metagenome]|uniref:Uncharacterized protein n=1 Tax=hydrocarbon metagenome TaxID=938273 RepID=A0A0W8G2L7_9ZZZZ